MTSCFTLKLSAACCALVLMSGCQAGEPAALPSPVQVSSTPSAAPSQTIKPVPVVQPQEALATPPDDRPFSQPRPLAHPLRFGDHGQLVRELQIRLRHAHYLATFDATDEFAELTQGALRNFQRDVGLPVTGVCDQATWDKLLPKSHDPSPAELTNTDIGPWFVGPTNQGFIRDMQFRLRQVGAYHGKIDGYYSLPFQEAVAAFRVSVELPASPIIDERTFLRLIDRSKTPSYNDLYDAPPARGDYVQQLDERCMTGLVICASKEQRLLSLVQDGQVLITRPARFAGEGYVSPPGDFNIVAKNWRSVSAIFGQRYPMPYAMFFNGDYAVHFSDDFVENGYQRGSHGCTQLRDYQAIHWIFEQAPVGTRVVIY